MQVRKARQDAGRPTAEAEQVPGKHKREWPWLLAGHACPQPPLMALVLQRLECQ
jgi:hypothetical protein